MNLLFIAALVAMFSCQVNANHYGTLTSQIKGQTLKTNIFMNSEGKIYVSPNSKYIFAMFINDRCNILISF